MDLMDGPKDEFYLIPTSLWLKEGNNEAVVWWTEIITQTIIGPLKVDES